MAARKKPIGQRASKAMQKLAARIVKKGTKKLKKIGGRMFARPPTYMQRVYVSPSNLGRFEAYLGKHFKSSLAYAMRIAGKQATILLRENTFIKDRGGFERGWQFEVKGMPALFIRNKQPYARFIELGRRPGKFPPVDAIRGWVKRQINPPPEQLNSVTYLVGRKIAKEGIPARPVMTDPGMQQMLNDLVFATLERVLHETVYKQALAAAMRGR